MSNKFKALLAVLAIVIFSGGTSPYIKLSLNTIPPMTFTFIRFFTSFLILLPIFLYIVKPRLKKSDIKLFYLSLLSTGNIIFFAYGIKLTMASVGQIIYAFTPIIVSLISFFLLKEKITKRKIFGILIGFIGVNLIITIPFFTKSVSLNNGVSALLGNFLIFAGCIGYSYYTVLSKKFLKDYSPMWLTISFVFTTAFISLLFVPFEYVSLSSLFSYFDKAILWSVSYVVIIGTVLAYLLHQYAIDRGTPLIASLMQYFFPASTLVWSYFILDEQLDIYLTVGLVLILSGAWLVTRET